MMFADLGSGTSVRFRLADVVCPDVDDARERITNDLEVSGRVVFLSDSGDEKDHYAVVQVDGIRAPLVVGVEKIKKCLNLSRAI